MDKLLNTPLLSVMDLTVYNRQGDCLLKNINLTLSMHETLAVIGASGAGKSLIFLAILGLLPQGFVATGKIRLNNHDLDQTIDLSDSKAMTALKAWRGRHIGMIFQEPMSALNPLKTVAQGIFECLRLAGVAKKAQKARALVLLDWVGLGADKLYRYPYQLSGGECQRALIAMTLAQVGSGGVVIADEPTTALDVYHQTQVLNLLQTLKERLNLGLMIISHDIHGLLGVSDTVMVMQAGQRVEYAAAKKIVNQPVADLTYALLQANLSTLKPVPLTDDSPQVLQVKNLTICRQSQVSWLSKLSPNQQTLPSLTPISFDLQVGQALGIVGASGVGKTTLVLALMKLLVGADVGGEVLLPIDGIWRDILPMTQRQFRPYRTCMQMVFQDPCGSLNPRMTVAQMIAEAVVQDCQVKNIAITSSMITSKVQAVLGLVSLPQDYAQRYAHEMSAGERQRVALARAMVVEPKILILDEPTAALDKQTEFALIKLLQSIQHQHKTSFVVISHDPKVVNALCHQVIVLT